MKTVAKIAAGALLLAIAAWIGTFLYWHVTILGAQRTIETQSAPSGGSPLASPEHIDAVDTLWSSGCRGLRYAVGALDPSRYPEFLSSMSHFVCWQSLFPGAKPSVAGSEALGQRIEEWMITSGDGPAERRKKCEAIRTWWAAEGGNHHQWWRVWSKSCPR